MFKITVKVEAKNRAELEYKLRNIASVAEYNLREKAPQILPDGTGHCTDGTLSISASDEPYKGNKQSDDRKKSKK